MEESGVGQTIPVSVESVFKDGFVVSFTSAEGLEFRGALLCQNCCSRQQLPTIQSPNSLLANPLSLLHDHPYTDMKQYAKHISNNIPPEVVLCWSSVPSVSVNSQGIAGRQERPLVSTLAKSSIYVVETDPESHQKATFPCYVPGVDRQAKFLAQLKIRADVEGFNGEEFRSKSRSRSVERPKGKKRSPTPVTHKRQRVQSPDPGIHGAKKSRVQSQDPGIHGAQKSGVQSHDSGTHGAKKSGVQSHDSGIHGAKKSGVQSHDSGIHGAKKSGVQSHDSGIHGAKKSGVQSPDSDIHGATLLKKSISLPPKLNVALKTFSIHLEKIPIQHYGVNGDVIFG